VLVLKIDTIPKPDGLGLLTLAACLEQTSNDFGSRSARIETCSLVFDKARKLSSSYVTLALHKPGKRLQASERLL